MKVVFDTNVLISSTIFDKSEAQKLLFKLIQLEIPIFSSTQILEEYQNVLKRDFKYSDEETANITKKMLSFLTLVESNQKINLIEEDPDDNKIIECAVASNSDFIATYDPHLIKIKKYCEIRIITPTDMRRLLK